MAFYSINSSWGNPQTDGWVISEALQVAQGVREKAGSEFRQSISWKIGIQSLTKDLVPWLM